MSLVEDKPIRISKKCKKCGCRLFDKVSPACGYVEIKCPKCGQANTVNLALRRRRIYYRLATA